MEACRENFIGNTFYSRVLSNPQNAYKGTAQSHKESSRRASNRSYFNRPVGKRRCLPIIFEGEELPMPYTIEKKSHRVFHDKDLLERILQFVDQKETFEVNSAIRRRKIDTKVEVDQQAKKFRSNSLYNCLFVNKFWHSATLNLLFKRIYFSKPANFRKFVTKYSGSCKKIFNPSTFVLEKPHGLKQNDQELIEKLIAPDNIEKLEFHLCSYFSPTVSWISMFKSLNELIFTGNKVIDDNFLREISFHSPFLETMDLRACDNITDVGVVAVALKCPKLKHCNLGRRRNGEKITNVSVIALSTHTKVETLGLAGCQIDDFGIWNLAQSRGIYIKRLSLNNCNLLTNNSLPFLFARNCFPILSVLEIKNIPLIDNLKSIAIYKVFKMSHGVPLWIQGCERINSLLETEENNLMASGYYLWNEEAIYYGQEENHCNELFI